MNYLAVSYDDKSKPKTSYPDELMRHIISLTALNGGTAVDVGCGRGDQLFALERLGFKVIGLDNEKSNDTNILNHHILDVGHDIFPLSNCSVDMVFSKSVIEHLYLPQIEHYMLEVMRIVKPGGYVVLMTPDWQYNYRDYFTEFTHVTPFTVRSLKQCVRMYGLEDVSVTSFIQIPAVWRFPFLKVVADTINILPVPKSFGKYVHWSKERVLLCVGRKSIDCL